MTATHKPLDLDQIWHYTCDHRAEGIRRDGVVNPNPQPLLGNWALSWWTDLGREHRHETGLTSHILRCDRMAHRFEVKDPASLIWWPHAARELKVPHAIREALEYSRLPAHWWISLDPIGVIV